MNTFKEMWKRFWKYVWECYKGSFLSGVTYVLGSLILMMLTMQEDTQYSTQITWCVVVIVCAVAYNALVLWNYGSMNFEMLVSGNMKRLSASNGDEYKISSHSYVKEYRPWKGFVMGAFISLLPLVFGILFGAFQEKIGGVLTGEILSQGYAILSLVGILLSGWSLLPFYCMNAAGITVSYYLSLLFALLPVVVSGAFYIIGAYAKRNKTIRAQQLADRAAAAEANKPKKINYGGLPGTKPRKKK